MYGIIVPMNLGESKPPLNVGDHPHEPLQESLFSSVFGTVCRLGVSVGTHDELAVFAGSESRPRTRVRRRGLSQVHRTNIQVLCAWKLNSAALAGEKKSLGTAKASKAKL